MKCGCEETEHGNVLPLVGQSEAAQANFFTRQRGYPASRFECTDYEQPPDEDGGVLASNQTAQGNVSAARFS